MRGDGCMEAELGYFNSKEGSGGPVEARFIEMKRPIDKVAPIRYAQLAAAQMAPFIKFDELSGTSSSHGGVKTAGCVQFLPLPRLH
ncbi:hypothetical protein CQW23_29116 [Capsicum baccatum]|uniref:Uncharacterized protein n=1 Tax=Capsicum baccatum TaxID=33114 RepID=A0A2G2VIK6_CAPBA|nr:hypothetical protein CQW23_29116 [Capsicum baccatum]